MPLTRFTLFLAAFFIATMGMLAVADHHEQNQEQADNQPEQPKDNRLTAQEQREGWKLLFDGETTEGWRCNKDDSINPGVIEDDALQVAAAGCRYLYYADETFDDYVLRLQMRQEKKGANSGIFLHIKNPQKPLVSGFEVQVEQGGSGMDSLGAIYDLVPAKMDMQKPAGKWNQIEIRSDGPRLSVKVNGEKTAEIDLYRWTDPGKRPDGSDHKFKGAMAERPREGYIMLQEHGARVWYKNIKIRELNK